MRKEEKPNKRDILKIRKNSEKEIVYHYKREERLSMPSAPKLDYGKKSIFRNNRALLILFLDVIIVIIIMFIVVRFFLGFPYRGSLGDYNLELKAFIYSQKVYVSLLVKKVREKGTGGGSCDVSFYLEGEKNNLYRITKEAPGKKNTKMFIRVQIPFSDEQTTVYALVKMNGKEIVLHRKVER